MFKKIGISLLVVFVFFMPLQVQYMENANAAVASKVASQAAKKVVKEVIVDEAINTAVNFALMEAIEIADNYEAKTGYKVVCPNGAATCDKPIQVKTQLTDVDKKALRGQTEIELEKAITNGKGLTKWQKFLDWFVPVWITTFAATALTYAIDPEARSLFNEVAYNALVSLGFITPVGNPKTIEETETELKITPEGTYTNSNGEQKNPNEFDINVSPGSVGYAYVSPTGGWNVPFDNVMIKTEIIYTGTPEKNPTIKFKHSGQSSTHFGFDPGNGFFVDNIGGSNLTGVIYVNGVHYYTGEFYSGSTPSLSSPEVRTLLQKKIESIRYRTPYTVNGKTYTDTLYNTVEGDVIHVQAQRDGLRNAGNYYSAEMEIVAPSNSGLTVENTIYTDIPPIINVLTPSFEEIESEQDIIKKSQYEDENGRVAIIPPAAITYEEEATGERVERKPNATGDGYVFEKPDGTAVPEEQVHVPPSWEPDIKPNPDGVPQITPSPTPSNPAPEPIPLTPSPTPQPEPEPGGGTGTPTTPGEEPPLEPFPDGESCDAKLKFPIFSPLKETFSTSFPFSIPWDIGRAIEAGFGDIGTEKPEYELSFDVAGEKQSWKITVPKFFDNWKPFTDSLLVFTFDVLIMFGIYRFVKGAGS